MKLIGGVVLDLATYSKIASKENSQDPQHFEVQFSILTRTHLRGYVIRYGAMI